jgi:uncharacterized protein
MDPMLSPIEARVLASLVEKSITTAEYYPLTLNALTAACNQKSNRDPFMQLDQASVVRALDSLREKKLAWNVTLAGSRVPKYRHSMTDVFPLTPQQLAVLCELMLRGPQTAAELRAHAARMAAIADVNEVQTILQELMAWKAGPLAGAPASAAAEEDRQGRGLVSRLPRQVGQREERFAQLLCGEIPVDEKAALPAPAPEPARVSVMAENERIAALETQVAALHDEMERLKARFEDFAKQFA